MGFWGYSLSMNELIAIWDETETEQAQLPLAIDAHEAASEQVRTLCLEARTRFLAAPRAEADGIRSTRRPQGRELSSLELGVFIAGTICMLGVSLMALGLVI